MTDNKGANRVYFVIVAIYVTISVLLSNVSWFSLPTSVVLIISQLIILIPAVVYCRIRKISIRKLIPYRKISFSTGILVVITTYLMYPLMMVLNMITLLFTQSKMAGLQMELSGFPLIVSTLLIAVMPACVEEFVFRGVLFQTYRRKEVFSAILLSAFLFGCMHMNVNQFVYTFVMGIYLAFLVEGTGSILSSMLAHFVINFTGVFVNWLMAKKYESIDMAREVQQTGNLLSYKNEVVIFFLFGILIWFIISIGTTAAAIAIYLQICKINGRRAHIKTIFQEKEKGGWITLPLLLAIGITVVIMVIRL